MIRLRLGTHQDPAYAVLTFACVVLYWVGVGFVAFRIRARHRETFDRLGGFAFLERYSDDRLKLAKYTLFSNAHWELGDWLLNAEVMVARVLFVASAILIVWPILRSIMT